MNSSLNNKRNYILLQNLASVQRFSLQYFFLPLDVLKLMASIIQTTSSEPRSSWIHLSLWMDSENRANTLMSSSFCYSAFSSYQLPILSTYFRSTDWLLVLLLSLTPNLHCTLIAKGWYKVKFRCLHCLNFKNIFWWVFLNQTVSCLSSLLFTLFQLKCKNVL